jgi:hypothetical protein
VKLKFSVDCIIILHLPDSYNRPCQEETYK